MAAATTVPPGCAGREAGESLRGRKLVVQMVQTHQPNAAPSFVERLDAFDLAASAGFALPPVMIYGDDVTHVVTEHGVANLLHCRSPQEREAALRAVAGDTEFGRRQPSETSDSLRRRSIVMLPSDLGIDVNTATRGWLAARTIDDLVTASGGLYAPPAKFRPEAFVRNGPSCVRPTSMHCSKLEPVVSARAKAAERR